MSPPLLFSSIISITFSVLLAALFFRISTQINSKGFLLLFLSALFPILITFFIQENIDLAEILENIDEFIAFINQMMGKFNSFKLEKAK